MANWHSKELGNGVEAYKLDTKIQEAYLTFVQAGQYSPDVAVFSRNDLETNMITFYFTPSAELLAKAFAAVPCEKPIPKEGFGLIVGDVRVWEVYFPEYLADRQSSRRE